MQIALQNAKKYHATAICPATQLTLQINAGALRLLMRARAAIATHCIARGILIQAHNARIIATNMGIVSALYYARAIHH